MSKTVSALLRLYSENMICYQCGHRFRWHEQKGCKCKFCTCTVTNPTFKDYVKKLTNFSCGRFIPIE